MKRIYTPDLYVRLRHGGTLDLSVCREDKVEILRAVTQSLDIDSDLKAHMFQICDAISTNRTRSSVRFWFKPLLGLFSRAR